MSDLDEPLPPGAGDEEEAPPGTEQAQEATQVDGLGAGKPEESVQPAAQPGADYASYYGQDQSYYGQQYAYPGYYGQGYPDAAAGAPLRPQIVPVDLSLLILLDRYAARSPRDKPLQALKQATCL